MNRGDEKLLKISLNIDRLINLENCYFFLSLTIKSIIQLILFFSHGIK